MTMTNETPLLHAQPRERIGSRYAQRVRRAGGLPGVIYGHGLDPVSVTFDAKDTITHIHKGEKVFRVAIEGATGEPETVLLRDIQFDHLGTNVIHADFSRVDLTERVHVRAHIHLVGQSACPGLKTAGAMLMHPASEIELDVQVSNIPDEIEVDISGMQVGDVLHARDVKLPLPTMKLLSDPEAVVAHIVEAKAEAESGEESEVGSGAAEPEVITEKKEAKED